MRLFVREPRDIKAAPTQEQERCDACNHAREAERRRARSSRDRYEERHASQGRRKRRGKGARELPQHSPGARLPNTAATPILVLGLPRATQAEERKRISHPTHLSSYHVPSPHATPFLRYPCPLLVGAGLPDVGASFWLPPLHPRRQLSASTPSASSQNRRWFESAVCLCLCLPLVCLCLPLLQHCSPPILDKTAREKATADETARDETAGEEGNSSAATKPEE